MNTPAGARAVAIAAADAAGELLRRHFRTGLAAATKDDDSPVTEADRAAEQAIRAVLAAGFPEFGVIGEELGGDRRGRYTWVIDPIDGTREFLTGRPTFVTLIALAEGDLPILGIIDQPITGERWVAADGRLDFTGPHQRPPRCRRRASLAEAELSCTSPDLFDTETAPGFARLKAACRRTSWGDDAYQFGLLALGAIDVVAEAAHKPWDWAAALPVVEAAGGAMCDWDGNPLRLFMATDGTVLALGDPSLRDAALAALRP